MQPCYKKLLLVFQDNGANEKISKSLSSLLSDANYSVHKDIQHISKPVLPHIETKIGRLIISHVCCLIYSNDMSCMQLYTHINLNYFTALKTDKQGNYLYK